jgi:DNA polymerase III subunit delta'
MFSSTQQLSNSTEDRALSNYPWFADLASKLDHTNVQAFLLYGMQYTGKLNFAKQIIASWLCTQTQVAHLDAISCGSCNSCTWYSAGSHPDFCYIEPNQHNIITVEQIAQLQEFIQISPHITGAKKVICIYAPESLNGYAANALLKTLEEPASNCIFLLISHRLEGVIATIRSRCQLIKAQAPNAQQAKTWLLSSGLDAAKVEALTKLFPVAPLLVAQLVSAQDDLLDNIHIEIIDVLLAQQQPIKLAARLAQIDIALSYSLLWCVCYELLQLHYGLVEPAQARYIPDNAQKLVKQLDVYALFGFVEQLQGAISALHQGYNLNKQLNLTSLLLQLRGCISSSPLPE